MKNVTGALGRALGLAAVLAAGVCMPALAATPLASIGLWERAQDINALTDAKSYSFVLTSTDRPLNLLGVENPAALTISCGPDGTLFFGVNWPDFIQPIELGSAYSSVAWRFDDRPMQTGRWLMADNHDHVFVPGNDAGAIVRALSISHKFVVGLTGHRGQQTATFDLTGSDQLPSWLASSCNIDLASPKVAASSFAPPPVPVAQVGPQVSFTSDRRPDLVMEAARKVLMTQGFKLDETQSPGTVMTQLVPYPLKTTMADCGGVLGLPYLIDKRAHTKLQMIVRVADGKVSVSTAMWGNYEGGYGAKDTPLICKTKLFLERTLADQLKAAL